MFLALKNSIYFRYIHKATGNLLVVSKKYPIYKAVLFFYPSSLKVTAISCSVCFLQHGHSLNTILNCSSNLTYQDVFIFGGWGGIFIKAQIAFSRSVLPLLARYPVVLILQKCFGKMCCSKRLKNSCLEMLIVLALFLSA